MDGWTKPLGLRSSATELSDFLTKHRVKVCCLQETKLTADVRVPPFPDYAVVCRDCQAGGRGGGLITLIHHSLQYTVSPPPADDGVAESLTIKTTIAGFDLSIVNLYIPPQSSCTADYKASIAPFLINDNLVVGDLNAHNNL